MRLYIGNLSTHTTVEELRECLSNFGEVENVKVSHIAAGAGFATMADEDAADVIQYLSGSDWDGRPLVISEARAAKGIL
jgi:RNA recognition motif-containing protein